MTDLMGDFEHEFLKFTTTDPITGLPVEIKDLDPMDLAHPTVRAQARVHLENCWRLK